MRVAIGSDHRGNRPQLELVHLLRQLGHQVEFITTDQGKAWDYPEVACLVASRVSRGEADRGILLSGRGIGMCIAANKHAGVRAAVCHDELTAEVSRRHHDLNVLCLAAEMLDGRVIQRLVEIWLNTPFEGGRHARRVAKIGALDQELDAQRASQASTIQAAASSALVA